MGFEKVLVKINKKTGDMSMEGAGFVGTRCDVLTDIEHQLGQVKATEDKPEKYQYVQPDYVPNQLSN